MKSKDVNTALSAVQALHWGRSTSMHPIVDTIAAKLVATGALHSLLHAAASPDDVIAVPALYLLHKVLLKHMPQLKAAVRAGAVRSILPALASPQSTLHCGAINSALLLAEYKECCEALAQGCAVTSLVALVRGRVPYTGPAVQLLVKDGAVPVLLALLQLIRASRLRQQWSSRR
jgi:hypothetical protein